MVCISMHVIKKYCMQLINLKTKYCFLIISIIICLFYQYTMRYFLLIKVTRLYQINFVEEQKNTWLAWSKICRS